jgi:protein-disulfide isomerase
MNRKSLFVGSAVVLVVAFVVGTLMYKSEKTQQSAQTVERNRANLVQFYSPTLGNPDAKVHIVEFLDPACETCRSFYPYVKQIMAANPDRVRLSIRHVPFHNGSDYVVKVLEAARKQGKYWQALEAMLASQAYWARNHTAQPELVWKPLEGLGLNLEQIKVDMNAPEIAQRIEQDLKDAKSLDVTKTPTFFVNGRPLPSFGLEQLQNLVKEALLGAY